MPNAYLDEVCGEDESSNGKSQQSDHQVRNPQLRVFGCCEEANGSGALLVGHISWAGFVFSGVAQKRSGQKGAQCIADRVEDVHELQKGF